MKKNKKFSKANLLYIFSMFLGLTIIVLGFSVANNAKKGIENIKQEQQSMEKQQVLKEDAKPVSTPVENVKKEENVVVVKVEEKSPKEDEFAPKLENYLITKPTNGEVSVSYTGKSLVYSKYFDDWSVHKGVDISASESAQVKAAANGRVQSVYHDSRLGTVIVLKHGDFTTLYGNLSTGELVKIGDEVYAGDVISGVGKSPDGKTFLHFEIEYKGQDIDPEPLLER